MAKILQKVFASNDQVSQSFTVQSWHVSQSIDAFTGTDDYDITISGSLTVTGSTGILGDLSVNGNSITSGYSVVNNSIIFSTGSNIAIVDSASFSPSTDAGNSFNIRMGYSAGQSTTNTTGSIIIGSPAGVGAQSASYSNIIGFGAGNFATFASASNIIGYNAGIFAASASYSNLFGYNAGRGDIDGNTIGPNNIIIGTNISLPYNYQNGINIGSIIFGSGSYSTTTGIPSSGSVGNGRIGINQPSPSFNLDVSGSGRFTNGVTITGSFISSGSISMLSTGSIILTGSLNTTGSVTLRGLTTSSQPFLVTINDSTGQLFYTSAVGLLASASQPSLPLNSYQFNNGGTFSGSSALIFSGGVVRGSGSFTGSFTGSFVGNLTGSAITLSTTRSNWSTNGTVTAVVGQLAWRNYGNGHTIFDASAGVSPDGNAINNTNSNIEWTATYPTLMGWNGFGTYGVRVDSSRVSNITGDAFGSRFQFNSYGNWVPGTAGQASIVNSNESQYQALMIVGNNSAGGVRVVKLYDTLQVQGPITANGTIQAIGADVIAFASSDKNLKDNITPISNPIEKIQKIGGYEFDWNDKQDTYEGHDIGVIAQEIEEVLPELVTTRDNGYKAVKYEKIVALLIEAIKDQQKQIEELKSKIG
jgi:hypothetical protein